MRMRRSRLLVVTMFLASGWLTGVPAPAAAQTPFVPYFFQNNIRYDKFDWHIYKTDHFEIYYYPEVESHLERVASYAESAYQHVSAELKHDLASKVPLIVFKTESEFLEQHVDPSAASEGVLAFAEPGGQPDGPAHRRAVGPAVPAHHARADAHFPVRHHPARHHRRAAAPLDGRGHGRLHGRRLESARSHDGSRRGPDRQRATDERDVQRADVRTRALRTGPCGLGIHRIQMGQGGIAPVHLFPPEERDRRRRECL